MLRCVVFLTLASRLTWSWVSAFMGQETEDLELWIISAEQYYAQYRDEMESETSDEFVGTDKIRKRFRDRDFKMKFLTKLFELRFQGSQQAYTTKFLHFMSQLSDDVPESIKRRFNQQNLKSETANFISQNIPKTLQDTIELAQRFEDSRPGHTSHKPDTVAKSATKLPTPGDKKTGGPAKPSGQKFWCSFCTGTVGRLPSRKNRNVLQVHAPPATFVLRHPRSTITAMSLWYAGVGKIYCYLSHAATISNSTISGFIDNGTSFNAVDPRVVERLDLPVVECAKPLKLCIGNNQQYIIPRLLSCGSSCMDFPNTDRRFCYECPQEKHILLGMPWLHEVNPRIDWQNMVIKARKSKIRTPSRPCVREGVAKTVGGVRKKSTLGKSHHPPSHHEGMLYYAKHTYASVAEPTSLETSDGEFCFLLQATEKATRQKATSWDALENRPVQQVALKYKDTVFQKELPSTPPTRTIDIKAEIDLNDSSPVARKQFRLSNEQKEAARKAVGWRIVHNFRAINGRVRVPATLISRKEDIYDGMAKGRWFSALALQWGFFQVRLRESNIPYTAFSTPNDLFEYLITPMCLSCRLAAFNRPI
ncbi:uncharacterized protein CCR75_001936 [Bremia lactucae]|uniref:Retrotransposon gag domain-containing protein n=1 Tax=Bremia lactucae TaxID=4779 RepID=A0A976IGQ8_BRELC|nr:hypothetical protein CCR75_001936 [Bremia lactucae]